MSREERIKKYFTLAMDGIKNKNGVKKWEAFKWLNDEVVYVFLRQRGNYKKALYNLVTDELIPITQEQYKILTSK